MKLIEKYSSRIDIKNIKTTGRRVEIVAIGIDI